MYSRVKKVEGAKTVKIEEVVYTAAITDKEIFYSSLEGPDWKDLPSFAYQISQGMVCS